MGTQLRYLKPNLIAQPLFGQWYAWSYLINPATAAMNVRDRHLKIMRSYVQAPMIHMAACQNPKLTGGPFMDLGGKQVPEIKALMDWTKQEQGVMLEFAEAVHELAKLLQEEAKGYSIEPLYEKVPELLQGYVELYYDLNNQPNFRFIESLLYRSRYFNPAYQSFSLSLVESDHRPFVLSTPVLEGPDRIHIRIPFADPRWDAFFAMERKPGDVEAMADVLGVPDGQRALFATFFTDEAPVPHQSYTGEGARVRYFGHACILLETSKLSIVADPVISYGYDTDLSRYTYSDLPDEIDYVLITHNHQDHVLLETLLKLRHKIKQVVIPRGGSGTLQDPSLRLILQSLGFRNVLEIDELQEIDLPGMRITGIPFLGEHCDLDIRTKVAHLVETDGHRILFAADSCNISAALYRHLHAIVGDLDVLFLGMECDGAPVSWLYGPLLSRDLPRDMDHSRRLAGSNYERARDIVHRFNFREVYVYAMGMEPWLKYIMAYEYTDQSNPILASNALLQDCAKAGIRAERLYGEKEILYGKELVQA